MLLCTCLPEATSAEYMNTNEYLSATGVVSGRIDFNPDPVLAAAAAADGESSQSSSLA